MGGLINYHSFTLVQIFWYLIKFTYLSKSMKDGLLYMMSKKIYCPSFSTFYAIFKGPSRCHILKSFFKVGLIMKTQNYIFIFLNKCYCVLKNKVSFKFSWNNLFSSTAKAYIKKEKKNIIPNPYYVPTFKTDFLMCHQLFC